MRKHGVSVFGQARVSARGGGVHADLFGLLHITCPEFPVQVGTTIRVCLDTSSAPFLCLHVRAVACIFTAWAGGSRYPPRSAGARTGSLTERIWAPHAGGHIQVGTSLVWSWTRVQRGWEAERQCIFGSIGLGLQGIKSHQCVPEGRKAGCLRRRQNKRLHGRPTLCLLRDCLAMPRAFKWLLPVRVSGLAGLGRPATISRRDTSNGFPGFR